MSFGRSKIILFLPKKNLKVLHLSSEKTWRGGEQQIAYLIEELDGLGATNFVLCKSDSAFEKHCQDNAIEYQSAGFKNSMDLNTSRVLLKLTKEIKPDLIHLHSSKSHGIAALATLLGLKIPLILSRRVDFLLKKNFLSQWKYNLPQIQRIICVSKTISDIVKSSVKKPYLVQTVYSGIDLEKFKKAEGSTKWIKKKFELPDESILIGNTSAIADHKDYFTFVDTAKIICENNQSDHVYFIIIGDGPMNEEIRSYVVNSGLEKRVHFTGFMDNVPQLLSELDIFLMTSKTEGLGTSVLDAFASRIPVVSTNGGGLKELVIHEISGLLSEVGDSKQLAKYLTLLIEDKVLRENITNGAYEYVQQFSKANTAKKTYSIYKEIVQK